MKYPMVPKETIPSAGISQETLKLIACVTMLIAHIGAALVLPTDAIYHADVQLYTTMAWINLVMRCIGRIAFPIFCFLLVEGVYHTRNPKKYLQRLAVGMVLSEIPFDLAFFRDGISWAHQSVMVTLLLGCMMVLLMNRSEGFRKLLWIVPFCCAAEWLHTDYGGEGILLIALFALAKGTKHEKWWQLANVIKLVILVAMGLHKRMSASVDGCTFSAIWACQVSGLENPLKKTIQTVFFMLFCRRSH